MPYEKELFEAVKDGNLSQLETYIQRGASLKTKQLGETLLVVAASEGHLHIVKWLIEKCGVFINEKDDFGDIALLSAARNGHLEIVKWLVEQKDISVNQKAEHDYTVLMCAACSGQMPIAQWLLDKGANVNEKNRIGFTAFMYAVKYRHLKIAQLLLEKGAPINEKNEAGDTALIIAASDSSLEVAKWLVENGASVNEKNKYGFTVFLKAVCNGQLKVAIWLAELNAASFRERDAEGNTALIMAASGNHVEAARWLVKNGASVNEKNKYGMTVLMAAIDDCHYDMFKLELVQWLLENGAAVNERDAEGNTALFYAAYRGHLQFVKLLINKDATVDVKNAKGDTVLMAAAYGGDFDITCYLLENGANVNEKNAKGYTALEIAADRGQLNLLQLLCQQATLHKVMAQKDYKLPLILEAIENVEKEENVSEEITLNLANWDLTDQEGSQVVEAIAKNKALTLTSLNLSSNPLYSKTVTAIAKLLADATSLKSLNLSHCKLNDNHVALLIDMLKINRSIQIIGLQSNPGITHRGAQMLIKAFLAQPCINIVVQDIDISHNPQLEASLGEKLARCLAQNKPKGAAASMSSDHLAQVMSSLPIYQAPAEVTVPMVREHDPMGTQKGETLINIAKIACEISEREKEQQNLQNKLKQSPAPTGVEKMEARLKTLEGELVTTRQTLKALVIQSQRWEAECSYRLNNTECFSNSPKLRVYFKVLSRKLEELFVGCKAVGSQLVRYTDRGYVGYILLAGEIASEKLLSWEVAKVAIENSHIPYISHLPSVFAVAGALDNLREKHAMQKISYQWSLQDLQRVAQEIAKRLTERYQEQLLKLPDKVYEEENLANQTYQACLNAINTITNSHNATLIDELVNYAVIRILYALKEERITRFEHDDELSIQDLAKQAVDCLASPIAGLDGFIKSLCDKKIAFNKESHWTVSGFYRLPGIRLESREQYHDDSGNRTHTILYGYRSGTLQEVQQLGYVHVADKLEEPLLPQAISTLSVQAPGRRDLKLEFENHFSEENVAMRTQLPRLLGEISQQQSAIIALQRNVLNYQEEQTNDMEILISAFNHIIKRLPRKVSPNGEPIPESAAEKASFAAVEAIGNKSKPPLSSSHGSPSRPSPSATQRSDLPPPPPSKPFPKQPY